MRVPILIAGTAEILDWIELREQPQISYWRIILPEPQPLTFHNIWIEPEPIEYMECLVVRTEGDKFYLLASAPDALRYRAALARRNANSPGQRELD